ncbi:hypothetical protein WFJ88_18785 [Yersinia enterocolitica]|uniref:hypothetical protein n=1 Tax=Yersinia enterocolitica TaxID=630 RepID=UPI00065A1C5D|nr:hypothetical protein [Yersinia enterocolitica]EKN5146930.1 hypothetical protein [Yersinia enterocolitica]EKN6407864.1 hypothetical protein [Yersinia enterocolitica]CRX53635.1 Uncharacterised protein [Yersinia enterocolitica]HDL7206744.1 hypothetical protein [Yersinia enterocolitica]HDL7382131.1 hypothetical protein [Yersinia enterocolitica]
MALITKEEAHSICNPYYHVFTSVFDNVWKNWLQNDVAHRIIDKRVRAAILRNDALYFLKDEIETNNLDGIKYIKVPHQIGFLILDKYFVRIKKGDKSFRSMNYPTQSALDFHNPNVDLYGGLIRLELLYILSDDGVGIDKIVLTQRNRKCVAWAIDLTVANVNELPIYNRELDVEVAQSTKRATPAKTVIRSRRAKKKEAKVANERGD